MIVKKEYSKKKSFELFISRKYHCHKERKREFIYFFTMFSIPSYILVSANIENQQYRDRAGFNSN